MHSYRASDGAEIFYAQSGPAGDIPLVMVHGWQADGSVWTPLVQALRPERRSICVDLRGFGASHGAPGPYGLERFAADLADLIAALDLDPVVLTGHSMGATVAQRFAVDHPDALEALVLLAPIPASGVALRPAVDAMFRATVGDPAAAAAWLRLLTVEELAPDLFAPLLRAAMASAPDAALESLDAWTGADFALEAATIETPALVIAPAADRPMTPALVKAHVADLLAGSRFEILENAGHYAQLERPSEIADLFDAFASEL